MASEVFISYARSTSATAAQALKAELGETAFLDTNEIQPGQKFPPEIFKHLLGSRVVVVFADATYFQRWYCLRELEAALQPFLRAGSEVARAGALEHVVVVLPVDAKDADTNHLPPGLRNSDWPRTSELQRLVTLVKGRLDASTLTLEARIAKHAGTQSGEVLRELLDRAAKPPPMNLASATLPVFPTTLPGSLQDDFVGRAEELALIHFVLSTSRGTATFAALTGSIEGSGGMGKTRLALEYVHRYGPQHFPGGIFWVDGETSDEALQSTFHGILRALYGQSRHRALMERPIPGTFKAFVEEGRDARHELAMALQAIADREPILYVVDNVPEPGQSGEQPKSLDAWCPARQKVALLVTSRQNISAAGGEIHGLRIDELPLEESVRLLTRHVSNRGALTPDQWREMAERLGRHPLALDLFNQVLCRGPGSQAEELLRRTREGSPTKELEERMQVLVKAGVVLPDLLKAKSGGIVQAFLVSYEKLSEPARRAARLIALLAPAPVPAALIQALEDSFPAELQIQLRDRHFVVPPREPAGAGEPLVFGSMHRLMADFLRASAPRRSEEWEVVTLGMSIVLGNAYGERNWALLEACVPHALHLRSLARSDAYAVSDEARAALSNLLSGAVGLLGRLEEAMVIGREAVEAFQRLATKRPEEFEPRLAMALNNLSVDLGRMGRREESLEANQKAVGVLRRLATNRPGAFDVELAGALNNLSVQFGAVGNLREALRAAWESVKVYTRLPMERLNSVEGSLAGALLTLSNRLGDFGRHQDAYEVVGKAVAIFRRRAKEQPEAFEPDLAMSLNDFCICLSAVGKEQEALAAIEEAVGVYRRLVKTMPEAFEPDLAMSLNHLSNQLRRTGKRERALEASLEAVEMYRRLATTRPEASEPDLAMALNNLAARQSDLGKAEEALKSIQEAVDIRRRWARALPEVFLPRLVSSLHGLVQCLEALGRTVEAEAVTAEIARIGRGASPAPS